MAHTHTGIFFLSTGRCGTQWLEKALAATYADTAAVTHEPIRGAYEPKLYLRAYDGLNELLSSEEISNHLLTIKETLKSKNYIETGWPSYPALPLIIDRLYGRVRIVHLVRHPVYTALSLATHEVYERKGWVSGAAINPFDQGIVQKELADDWGEMGMYEKCLFWWTEINLYALELRERYPDIEFYFMRYEDLFDSNTPALQNLIRFMGLTYNPAIEELRFKKVDRYHWESSPVDWRLIFKYPKALALAKQFGYDFNDLSAPHIATRYFHGGQEQPEEQRPPEAKEGKWRGVLKSIKNIGRSSK